MKFLFNGGRNCGEAACAKFADVFSSIGQVPIAGLHVRSESKVGLGVLVSAVNGGFRRKGRKPVQGLHHLGGCAFEDSAASSCKERVATQNEPVSQIRHVASCVAGNVDDIENEVQLGKLQPITTADRSVDEGDGLTRRTMDRDLPAFKQRRDPPDVVRVVVSQQNGSGFETAGGQLRRHRRAAAGVHHEDASGVRYLQNPDVIFAEHGNRPNLQHPMMVPGPRPWVNGTDQAEANTPRPDRVNMH